MIKKEGGIPEFTLELLEALTGSDRVNGLVSVAGTILAGLVNGTSLDAVSQHLIEKYLLVKVGFTPSRAFWSKVTYERYKGEIVSGLTKKTMHAYLEMQLKRRQRIGVRIKKSGKGNGNLKPFVMIASQQDFQDKLIFRDGEVVGITFHSKEHLINPGDIVDLFPSPIAAIRDKIVSRQTGENTVEPAIDLSEYFPNSTLTCALSSDSEPGEVQIEVYDRDKIVALFSIQGERISCLSEYIWSISGREDGHALQLVSRGDDIFWDLHNSEYLYRTILAVSNRLASRKKVMEPAEEVRPVELSGSFVCQIAAFNPRTRTMTLRFSVIGNGGDIRDFGTRNPNFPVREIDLEAQVINGKLVQTNPRKTPNLAAFFRSVSRLEEDFRVVVEYFLKQDGRALCRYFTETFVRYPTLGFHGIDCRFAVSPGGRITATAIDYNSAEQSKLWEDHLEERNTDPTPEDSKPPSTTVLLYDHAFICGLINLTQARKYSPGVPELVDREVFVRGVRKADDDLSSIRQQAIDKFKQLLDGKANDFFVATGILDRKQTSEHSMSLRGLRQIGSMLWCLERNAKAINQGYVNIAYNNGAKIISVDFGDYQLACILDAKGEIVLPPPEISTPKELSSWLFEVTGKLFVKAAFGYCRD